MSLKIEVNTTEFSKLIGLAQAQVDTIQQEAYKYFRDHTPKRSGNARRNTRRKGDEIEANYAYAQRLDQGWSKQAPNGMTEPTIDHIEKVLIPQAVRRINRGN